MFYKVATSDKALPINRDCYICNQNYKEMGKK